MNNIILGSLTNNYKMDSLNIPSCYRNNFLNTNNLISKNPINYNLTSIPSLNFWLNNGYNLNDDVLQSDRSYYNFGNTENDQRDSVINNYNINNNNYANVISSLLSTTNERRLNTSNSITNNERRLNTSNSITNNERRLNTSNSITNNERRLNTSNSITKKKEN